MMNIMAKKFFACTLSGFGLFHGLEVGLQANYILKFPPMQTAGPAAAPLHFEVSALQAAGPAAAPLLHNPPPVYGANGGNGTRTHVWRVDIKKAGVSPAYWDAFSDQNHREDLDESGKIRVSIMETDIAANLWV